MRKSCPKSGHELNVSTATATIDTATYGASVRNVLLRVYGPLKNAEKILARHAKTCPNTARNWLRGASAPRGAELIRLMGECDELTAEILRLAKESKCSR